MRIIYKIILISLFTSHVLIAQVFTPSRYRKGSFVLQIDKKPKAKVEDVTFMFGSGSANDSILFFVNNVLSKTITPVPLHNQDDILKNATAVHFASSKKQKSLVITAVSLKQKQYVSIMIDNRYKLVRIDLYPSSSYITKTNKPLQIE